jgi:hypothetical protein
MLASLPTFQLLGATAMRISLEIYPRPFSWVGKRGLPLSGGNFQLDLASGYNVH